MENYNEFYNSTKPKEQLYYKNEFGTLSKVTNKAKKPPIGKKVETVECAFCSRKMTNEELVKHWDSGCQMGRRNTFN
jgi:hypothetical protein